jgi:hypothetical protein
MNTKAKCVKKIIGLFIILFVAAVSRAQSPSPDSLSRAAYVKKQIAKGDTLTRLALAMAKPGASNAQLNQALAQIDNALHIYSKYRYLDGVRQSFDNLAFIYRQQKKHSQEKWYILQSNTLSRQRLDTPNIINSLIRLATVKQDIKDYGLAGQDLTEAANLAQKTANTDARIVALQSLAQVYKKSNDLKNAANTLNLISGLQDSIKEKSFPKNALSGKRDTLRPQSNDKNNLPSTVDNTNKYIYIALIISILMFIISFFTLRKRKV